MAGRPGTPRIDPEALDDDRAIRRLVFNLAWPVIVENLLQTLVGVVDLLMVAQLGAAAIAGVGVSVQVLFVIFAAIAAVATGTTVLVARFTGAGEPQNAARVAKQSILLGIALGVLLALFGVPGAKPLVALLGAGPDVVELGGGYLEIVFLTAAALTLSFVLSAALRGAGDSRSPMVVALGMNVVNVLVAYVLIFGVPAVGIPAMGVVGSAWGAAAGRIFGAGALLLMVITGLGLRGRARLDLGMGGLASWLPDVSLIGRVLKIGLPTMAEQLSRSLGMLFFSWVVISLGTQVFAAQRITFSIISLSFLPGMGFAMAATALTGQALGARKPDRAERATWFSVRSAMLWMGSMGVIFLVTAPWLIRLFAGGEDADALVALGSPALQVLAFGQPQVAMALVLAGGLRGAGDTRFPMLNTTLSMWLLRVPIAWIAVTQLGLGLPGAYAAFVIGSTVECFSSWLRYRTGRWRQLRV